MAQFPFPLDPRLLEVNSLDNVTLSWIVARTKEVLGLELVDADLEELALVDLYAKEKAEALRAEKEAEANRQYQAARPYSAQTSTSISHKKKAAHRRHLQSKAASKKRGKKFPRADPDGSDVEDEDADDEDYGVKKKSAKSLNTQKRKRLVSVSSSDEEPLTVSPRGKGKKVKIEDENANGMDSDEGEGRRVAGSSIMAAEVVKSEAALEDTLVPSTSAVPTVTPLSVSLTPARSFPSEDKEVSPPPVDLFTHFFTFPSSCVTPPIDSGAEDQNNARELALKNSLEFFSTLEKRDKPISLGEVFIYKGPKGPSPTHFSKTWTKSQPWILKQDPCDESDPLKLRHILLGEFSVENRGEKTRRLLETWDFSGSSNVFSAILNLRDANRLKTKFTLFLQPTDVAADPSAIRIPVTKETASTNNSKKAKRKAANQQTKTVVASHPPFNLILKMNVSIPDYCLHTPTPQHLTESQRLVFSVFFSQPTSPATYSKHHYNTSLPFFYSVLKPAKGFDDSSRESWYQPEALESSLLPFQKRTVQWLLSREKKKLNSIPYKDKDGDTVHKITLNPVDPQDEMKDDFCFEQLALPMRTTWDNTLEEIFGEALIEAAKSVDEDTRMSTVKGKGKQKEDAAVGSTAVPLLESAGIKYLFESEVKPPIDLWFCRLNGDLIAVEDVEKPKKPSLIPFENVRGGILAEEMGLGKTLEVISLTLLNQKPEADVEKHEDSYVWDGSLGLFLRDIKATMIVAPATLIQQWADEIGRHAPSLNVLIYDGAGSLPFKVQATRTYQEFEAISLSNNKKEEEELKKKVQQQSLAARPTIDKGNRLESEWWSFIDQFDVCLTTYDALSKDLAVAKKPLERTRRNGTQYKDTLISRSPLVMVRWWRVIMDEAQLANGGNVAEMVSLLPRLSSYAVSGTPAKATPNDLKHVLRFLGVPLPHSYDKYWSRICAPPFASIFTSLVSMLSTRTVKSQVAGEMRIPPQRRFLVPITQAPIEEHYYEDTFTRALTDVRLDPDGNFRPDDEVWEIDMPLLRGWLHTLRQIATHVQIGALNMEQRERRNRIHLGRNVLSLSEVLEKMVEDNLNNMMSAERVKIDETIKKTQLLSVRDVNLDRTEKGEGSPLRIRTMIKVQMLNDSIKLISSRLEKIESIVKPLKAKLRSLRIEEMGEEDANDDSSESEDEESGGRRRTDAEKELSARLTGFASRTSDLLVLRHKAEFLLGDNYHEIEEEAEENRWFVTAEETRKTLLKEASSLATRKVKLMGYVLNKQGHADEETMEIASCRKGFLLSRRVFEEVDEVLDILNDNTLLLWEHRAKIFTLLSTALNTEDDQEVDGEEYNRGRDSQGEAWAYLEAFMALIVLRREVLNGQRTANDAAQFDRMPINGRKSQKSKEAGQLLGGVREGLDLDGHEEAQALAKKLMVKREELRARFVGNEKTLPKKTLGDLISECANAMHRAEELNTHAAEAAMAKTETVRLKKILKEQIATCDTLLNEYKAMSKAWDAKALYYVDLQKISDTVEELGGMSTEQITKALNRNEQDVQAAELRLGELVSKSRYMEHLKERHADPTNTEVKECIICQDEIQRGMILSCGHLFCEECFNLVKRKSAGGQPKCAVCRTTINISELHKIRIESANTKVEVNDSLPTRNEFLKTSMDLDEQSTTSDSDFQGKGRDTASPERPEFNFIPPSVQSHIDDMEVIGSWGSKIERMVKHLRYLALSDKGSKSIVFSAWLDAFSIVQRAFNANGIKFVSYVTQTGRNLKKGEVASKFIHDPSIQVILLHGERESSGLTLTVAKYCFLLEPTVSTSFEAQAIGRVDRLGQKNETQVYCYYTKNTVEEHIITLQAIKGVSIYLKSEFGTSLPLRYTEPEDEGDDIQTSAQAARLKLKSDFVANGDDLISLFFPHRHLRGYLAPPLPGVETALLTNNDEAITRFIGAENAERRMMGISSTGPSTVAGPSRSR